MTNRTCYKEEIINAFPITLTQQGIDRFTVIYGKQIKARLTYGQAATELGACIMHALACEDLLDNREPRR